MNPELERLRAIKSFPSLVKYLRDDLDWPIDSDNVEDLTFEYQAEELGLDPKTADKIKGAIKQLRPFVTGQPWGIFYINFEPKQLPVVALRRILSKLVLKKRASGNKSQQATWQLNDLLFISSYGESAERAISFAHFSEDKQFGDLPTLRVLGWDSQDTVLRLEDVEQTLSSKLRWPDDEENVDDWRKTWSSAFTLRPREVVRTSKELAVKLADLAIVIRERANRVLAVESDKGPMRKLYHAFQEALIHDLDEDDFADMYAQTIAYGLLTARVSVPSGLVVENVTDLVPITNPFLKELLQTFLTVGGRKGKIDFDELGINEVVDLLRIANMEAVLKDFGDRNPLEDPVIHFYELFLKEYDPEKRMRRGVFYTPRPVVSFIVRSVDEILRTEFGLEDGLADTTTWGELKKRRKGLKVPAGVKPDEPFVQILDPATGTGTFLVEVIDRIYETLRAKWTSKKKSAREMDELWNDYVPRHLLPRLHGFELMMAPYAIAHMKIGLKLRETHYSFLSSERSRIYLTNTLEQPKDFAGYLEQMAPALAHEAEAANRVKRSTAVTVIVGNPPYSKISSNLTPEARAIVEPYRYVAGDKIVERGALQFEINLQDDYVKFTRWCEERVGRTGNGVMGMITNNGYLGTPTLRGMRYSLMQTFSRISIVDLHGHLAKGERSPAGETEGNVFEIQQGVAIILARDAGGSESSAVDHVDVYGTQSEKYAWLQERLKTPATFVERTPLPPFYRFLPGDAELTAEFDAMFGLQEVFPKNSAGIITARDSLAIDFDCEELLSRIKRFRQNTSSEEKIYETYDFSASKRFDLRAAQRSLLREAKLKPFLRPILHRPFDQRCIFYHEAIVWSLSRPVANEMFPMKNLALVATRQVTRPQYEHVFVSRSMIEIKACSHDRNTQIFPLFLRDDAAAGKLFTAMPRRPNIGSVFSEAFARISGLSFNTDEATSSDSSFGPVDLLHFTYAVLHSCSYRTRYFESLRSSFPQIPVTSDTALFRKLCAFGADLVALHLLEDDYDAASWNTSDSASKNPLETSVTVFGRQGDSEVARGYPKYKDGSVYINPGNRFAGVPESVWNFRIGGYQVCEKWLKERRGRILSDEEIDQYQRIVVALNETIRLTGEIDRVIEEHGGWPLVGSQDARKPELLSI